MRRFNGEVRREGYFYFSQCFSSRSLPTLHYSCRRWRCLSLHIDGTMCVLQLPTTTVWAI